MIDPAAGEGLRHTALFYRSQAEYRAALIEFTLAALGRGEHVMMALPGECVSLLRDSLPRREDEIVFVDMASLGRNPAGIIPAVRAFVDSHQGRRVSYVGQPSWPGRTSAELVEVAKHEALINLAFASAPATMLCPYDRARLPRCALSDAERTHPWLIRRGIQQASYAYVGANHLPSRCEAPLPSPPPSAERLPYDCDLRPVRAVVSAWAARAGLPEARCTDLVLAVSEVAANTLRHTPAGGVLHVWRTAEEMVCQTHDRGWITDPLAGRRRPPAESAGGQGLWVVNQVCDLVEMRTGHDGTTVRMHMALRRPPPELRWHPRSRWAARAPTFRLQPLR